MEKDRMFSTRKTAQVAVDASWLVQKNEVSTGFGVNYLSQLSNFQIYLPLSSKSLHHLNPTNSLPVTFLTVQKSRALKTTTMMKVFTSEKKLPKMK